MPKLCAIWALTTEAPALVVPAPPNRIPSCLSSISAMKLSDGEFVSWMSVASRGELTAASGAAVTGVSPEPTRVPFITLTPAAPSAESSCCAANCAGWA